MEVNTTLNITTVTLDIFTEPCLDWFYGFGSIMNTVVYMVNQTLKLCSHSAHWTMDLGKINFIRRIEAPLYAQTHQDSWTCPWRCQDSRSTKRHWWALRDCPAAASLPVCSWWRCHTPSVLEQPRCTHPPGSSHCPSRPCNTGLDCQSAVLSHSNGHGKIFTKWKQQLALKSFIMFKVICTNILKQ